MADKQAGQQPTAGLCNAGFISKIKFIAFYYLRSRGQRSAPKPRTSQARGTLNTIARWVSTASLFFLDHSRTKEVSAINASLDYCSYQFHV